MGMGYAGLVGLAALALAAVALLSNQGGPRELEQGTYYPQQARMTQLAGFNVGGALEIPDHPPGMPYMKTDPMGTLTVTSPDGDALGKVDVKTMPPPVPPPPTIIRFGDVGVAGSGCPMCPVLDKKAVEKQKIKMENNARRIEKLKKAIEGNTIRIEKSVETMKTLKEVLGESIFQMKEAVKNEDTQLEGTVKAKEDSIGPEGPPGAPGYNGPNGINGINGRRGAKGLPGVRGPQGPVGGAGLMGVPGPPGIHGPQGPVGIRGKIGPLGPRGKRGPHGASSQTLKCDRIGGLEYKGVCFKSSVLKKNKDIIPEGCRPWSPSKKWNEADWWNVAQMFKTLSSMTNTIDRDVDGGRCDNHKAVTSFSQKNPAKVWVNERTFSFNPTAAGSTCNLYNDDDTVAVYACAV